MVAIKPANERLNAKDLWPGLPWTSKDTLRIRDECRQRAIESGVTESHYLVFAEAREWKNYMSMFPRVGDRQKILAKIYPSKKPKQSIGFTDEELGYIQEKLSGVNDPLGRNILDKIESFFG